MNSAVILEIRKLVLKTDKEKRTDNTGTIFWCNLWIFRMLSIQSTQLICHIGRNLPKLDLCWGFSSCYVSFKTRLVYQQGKVDNGADLIGVREDLEASHDGQEQGRGATANVLCGQWTALMADNRQLDISGSPANNIKWQLNSSLAHHYYGWLHWTDQDLRGGQVSQLHVISLSFESHAGGFVSTTRIYNMKITMNLGKGSKPQ